MSRWGIGKNTIKMYLDERGARLTLSDLFWLSVTLFVITIIGYLAGLWLYWIKL